MNRKHRKLMAWAVLLLLILPPAPLSRRSWGESKGPATEQVPDIDDVLAEGKGGSSGGDTDSLQDLEKVIEAEEERADVRLENADTAPVGERSAANLKEGDPTGVSGKEIDDALFLDPTEAADRKVSEAPKPSPQPVPDSDLDLPEFDESSKNAPPEPRPALNEPLPRSDVKNQITNLEFKMEGPSSRIVVSSRGPLRYREVRNPQVKQVVYFFENTETPNRLQRAYDTTEFISPVALFTILQMPKEVPPVTKLIVQMREDKSPVVTPNERGVYIDFPAPDKKDEQRLILGDNDPRLATEENIYSGAQTFSGKSISRLEVKNTDVQDVLRLIAKSSGYNVVIGDDVTGKVGTLSLQNVPWDQAFTLVLQTKKLGYVRQGNVIRVATLGSLKGEKEESVANEQSRIKVEPLRTVLIPISYAKATDLSNQAKNFLSERGTLDVDARTNTVIVKDIDRSVNRIQKLFAALDTQPARVSISAKIVEMNSSFTRNIGFRQLNFGGDIGGVNLNQQILFDTKGTTITTLRAPSFANLLSEFRLGELENKVKTLANPSVSVVANQQATINQALSFFVINGDAVAGGQVIPGVRQITANLTMDVTPIVSGDGSIFMTVNIRNEIPVGAPPNIQIDSRNVQTQVLVENGDTAVVGGIFQNTVNTAKEGVPFLMRIPILGFFFSRSSVTDTKNEIFIFLTAKIMNAEESFKRAF